MSKLKEVNKMYIDRIIKSLTEDKEKWVREVNCGMEGCFVEYYSPKYKNTSGDIIMFSDRGLAGAHINGMLSWEIGFWDYFNPFSDRSSKLRKVMREMKRYLITKDEVKRLDNLEKTIDDEKIF